MPQFDFISLYYILLWFIIITPLAFFIVCNFIIPRVFKYILLVRYKRSLNYLNLKYLRLGIYVNNINVERPRVLLSLRTLLVKNTTTHD